ncbi:CHAP domain-containing protein [Ktedonobacter robiniae]|uniref:Peptidase C51 domain-containing protein n=1 Tax=Ktedonobacter robiniae TaxID=2778365 RepID=A0ABQ3UXW7_9CHLR|nr:CHAP domain-containing protein [Ktedonobacter robiniae]GHO57160.1 hypothetical protein KSB_56350 [Ktedonobacter robiniae]
MSAMDREPTDLKPIYGPGPYSGTGVFTGDQQAFYNAPNAHNAGGGAPTPIAPTPEYGQTGPLGSPNTTRALLAPNPTTPLPYHAQNKAQTGMLGKSKTTALREPLLIKGEGKRETSIRPPQGRRAVIQISVAVLMLFIMVGSLLAVNTLGGPTSGSAITNPANLGLNNSTNLSDSQDPNQSSILSQAATATAVSIYGNNDVSYSDNGSGGSVAGGSSNHGAYGQCTYWAAMRFHAVTGVWVPWYGNAWEWASGALQYGWRVSSKPSVGAIIVLQPGVQGAGGVGHVAYVESINADGSVYTSNYNWYNNGGGFARLSYWTFYPGSGVSFITLP